MARKANKDHKANKANKGNKAIKAYDAAARPKATEALGYKDPTGLAG